MISKELLNDEFITDKEITTYLVLQCIATSKFENIICSPKNMVDSLTGVDPSNRFANESIFNLDTRGYVKIQKLSNMLFKINIDSLKIPEEKSFVNVDYDDFIRLLKRKQKNKHAVIRYYCGLVGTINYNSNINGNKNVTSRRPLAYLAAMMNCDITTVLTYNKVLEDMHIIYINRTNRVITDSSGKKYRDANVYGLYKNKQYIIQSANNKRDESGRKYAALYNQMKKGKHYTPEIEKKVMDYINKRDTLA